MVLLGHHVWTKSSGVHCVAVFPLKTDWGGRGSNGSVYSSVERGTER